MEILWNLTIPMKPNLMKKLTLFLTTIVLSSANAQVVINEIMAAPTGGITTNSVWDNYQSPGGNAEWIELYNSDPCNDIDISCYTIGSNQDPTTGTGTSNYGTFTFPAGSIIPAGGYLVIGGSASPNLDIDLDAYNGTAYICGNGRWFLRNTNGYITLFDPTNTVVDAVYWSAVGAGGLTTEDEFDNTGWTSTCTCGAGLLMPEGQSIPGIEYTGATTTGLSMARSDDGSLIWADNYSPTPGACNSGCVDPLVLNGTGVNEVCSGSDGSVTVSVTGGTPPYTYSWTGGSTTQSVANLSAGTYTVTVTDNSAGGCGALTASVDVNIGNDGTCCTNNLTATTSSTDNTVCGGSSTPCVYNGPAVVFNEIRFNPGSGTNSLHSGQEFIELYNPSPCDPIDLSCYVLGGKKNNSYKSDWTLRFPAGTIIPPLGFLTVGGDNVVPAVDIPFSMFFISGTNWQPNVVTDGTGQPWLENSNDWKALYDPNGTPVCGLAWGYSFDDITYINNSAHYDQTPGPVAAGAAADGCPAVSSLVSIRTMYNGGVPVDFLSGTGTGVWSRATDGTGAWGFNNDPSTATVSDCNGICNPPFTGGGGSCDGTATITPSGGTGPYTYVWDAAAGSQTAQTATALCAGCYDVTVTDQGTGCTYVETICVNDASGPTITYTATDVTCNGSADGSIDATISPAGTYTYDWNGGTYTTEDLANLAPGTYDLVVTNTATNCTASITIQINEPAPITGTSSGTDVTTPNGSDGTVTAVGGNGTPGYTYQWDAAAGNATTQTVTGLPAGCYNVVITDANGCTYNDQVCITEPTCNLSLSGTETQPCAGGSNGEAAVAMTNGSAPYTFLWSNGAAAGQTTNPAVNLPAGSYSVTVTDANNCTSTTTVVVTDPTPLSVVEVNNIPESCTGGDGELEVAGNGGFPTYLYSIDGGTTWQGSETFSGLTAGPYTVTIQDENLCESTVAITIAGASSITGNVDNVIDITCNGNTDGEIQVSATGGATPYQYSLDGGTTWQPGGTFTGLAQGNYTITIQDNTGCQTTVNATINEPAALVLSLDNSTDVSCNGGNDGEIVVSSIGGTLPYQYSIDAGTNFQSTGDFTGLSQGNYTILVEDANGCNTDIPVNINEPTPISLSTSTVDESCGAANGEVSVTATGGTVSTDYSYLWSDPGNSTTGNVTGLIAGTYTVTVTDDNGCTQTAIATVNNAGGLSASINTQSDVSCFGLSDGDVEVIATGGSTPYSYDIGGGPQASGIFTGLTAGNFTVVVTDDLGCAFNVSVTISEPTQLDAQATQTDILCNGGTDGEILVTASGGTPVYSYDIGQGNQATGDFNGLLAGAYTVTVSDQNGCQTSVNATVIEPSAIVLNATSTDENCGLSDGTAQVNATGGIVVSTYQYEWLNSASTQLGTSDNIINLPADTYTVNVTDDNSCIASTTVIVSNIGGGTASAVVDSNVDCFGNCTGQATASITGGTAPYAFQWSGGTTPNNEVAQGLCEGNYTVTVTDDVGCISVSSVNITEPTAITGGITTIDETCLGDCTGSIEVNATGGTSPYQYSYDNGVTFTPISNQTGLCASTYSITIQDDAGCSINLSADVLPGAAYADASIIPIGGVCANESPVNLSALQPGGTWSGDGIIDPVNGTFDPSAGTIGVNNVTYTIGGLCGDTQTTQVIINEVPTIAFEADVYNGCEPLQVVFTNTGDSGDCIWDLGDGTIIQDCGPINHTYSSAGIYDVGLTVTNANNCSSSLTNFGFIEVYPNPVADFSFSPQSATVNNPLVNFTDESIGANQWSWNFNGEAGSSDQNPSYTFDGAGIYPTTLVVTSIEGCVDSVVYEVVIEDEFSIYVPNAFTPDGDGNNDNFFAVLGGKQPDSYELMVFNRWGELIFNTTDQNMVWDGTYKGVMSPTDVYVWKIKCEVMGSFNQEYIGHVSLLK